MNRDSLTDLGSPEGIAIDHLGRTVFWTDSVKDRIEVASLDGSQRRVIVDSDLVNPRAIVADPPSGCLFQISTIRVDLMLGLTTVSQQESVLDRLEPRRPQDRDLLHGRIQQEGPGQRRPGPAKRPDVRPPQLPALLGRRRYGGLPPGRELTSDRESAESLARRHSRDGMHGPCPGGPPKGRGGGPLSFCDHLSWEHRLLHRLAEVGCLFHPKLIVVLKVFLGPSFLPPTGREGLLNIRRQDRDGARPKT